MTDASGHAAVSLRQVDKYYGAYHALRSIDLEIAPRERIVICGPSGSGKSTLIRCINRLEEHQAGKIVVDGIELTSDLKNIDKVRSEVGMVFQHFKLVENFTVLENIILGAEDGRLLKPSLAKARKSLMKLADDYGLKVDPDALVQDIGVGMQQRVEILKALYRQADILILDEPTGVLTPAEADQLFRILGRLRSEGKTIILITHKLREVAGYCDRITVMRQGRTVLAEAPIASVTMEEVARHAVGETSPAPVRSAAESAGAEVLALKGLSIARAGGGLAVDGLSLSLRAGEILGIAGVGGNGQSELVACLNGLLSVAGGQLEINGADMTQASIAARRAAGLRVIPADRFDSAMARGLTLAENLAMTEVPTGAYGGALRLRRGAMRKAAEQAIADREIRGGGPATQAALLSGGNAQKLLLARELAGGARVIVAHSPSRGLDMRAARAVHVALVEAVAQGAACLLVSEELEEVIALSHRITVMNRGALSAPLNAAEATPARLGELMVGHA